MRIEGMDAATKAAPVPVINIDMIPAKQDVPAIVFIRNAAGKDHEGYVGVSLRKNRNAQENQTFELKCQPQDEEISEKVIRDAIERANRALSGSDRKFEISIHEKTREIMIKVLDTKTNETIREIPPKKIVDLVVCLCEMAGILYDEKG
jgi:flagellar protein FlaG